MYKRSVFITAGLSRNEPFKDDFIVSRDVKSCFGVEEMQLMLFRFFFTLEITL